MKLIEIIVLTILLILGGIEISLRWFLGLGNPPLYIADPEIGYKLAPNQKVRRYGKTIIVNNYSMRSEKIKEKKPRDMVRILLIGDSIANGAWWTDQKETISSLLETKLNQQLSANIEVLNASANSWGPRNQLAYLEKFGTFEAQMIILLLNTDDFFAIAPHSLVVGKDKHYPNRKPPLALIELLQILLPQPPLAEMTLANQEKGDRVGFNLTAIAKMQQISQENQAKLIILLSPLKRETEGVKKQHEIKARQRLEDLVTSLEIPYLDLLPLFAKIQPSDPLYRDHIHLNQKGNELLTDNLVKFLTLEFN
jgi:lysophospholipase L1-like esterase